MDATTESPEATTAEQSDTPEEASAPTDGLQKERILSLALVHVVSGLRTRKPEKIEAFIKEFKEFIEQHQSGSTPLPIDDAAEMRSEHHTHRWPLRRTEVLVSVLLTEESTDEQFDAYVKAVGEYANTRTDVAWFTPSRIKFVLLSPIKIDLTADGCS